MLGAPRPEPVGETEKIHLVDGVQYFHHRALDDLVLQRSDAERPLPAVGFGDVLAPRWLRPIRTAHDAVVQVADVPIERPGVFLPCHPIDTGRCLRLELMEGPGQQVRCHVVHQGREPFTLVPLRSFSYAGQRL